PGRSIGRDGQEVAALTPRDVAVQLVQKRVAGLERAGHRRIGVLDQAGQGVHVGLTREAGDLHVTEAVEGEVRLVHLLAVAGERVPVGGLRGAQVVGVDGAVVVEHLGMAQLDGRSGRALDAQADRADHVLTRVYDIHAVFGLGDLHRRDFFSPANWRVGRRDQSGGDVVLDDGRLPPTVVEAGLGPAGRALARIVGLAHQPVRG